MKKIICKVEYDTETAELIRKCTSGTFGDPEGYEETLYCTAGGHYFEYVCGGESSIHPVEKITRMSKAKAEAWMEAHNAQEA